jgi:hypothetical protein
MCVDYRAMALEKRNLPEAMVSIGSLGLGAVTGGVPKTNLGSRSSCQLGSSLCEGAIFSGWKLVAPTALKKGAMEEGQ